eukprot:jgi/Mesen1/6107/ME000310S05201
MVLGWTTPGATGGPYTGGNCRGAYLSQRLIHWAPLECWHATCYDIFHPSTRLVTPKGLMPAGARRCPAPEPKGCKAGGSVGAQPGSAVLAGRQGSSEHEGDYWSWKSNEAASLQLHPLGLLLHTHMALCTLPDLCPGEAWVGAAAQVLPLRGSDSRGLQGYPSVQPA